MSKKKTNHSPGGGGAGDASVGSGGTPLGSGRVYKIGNKHYGEQEYQELKKHFERK
jgi:hypothetical protein